MLLALLTFIIGVFAVFFFVIRLKLPAFIGLTLSAFIVGIVTPEVPFAEVPSQIATIFGNTMAGIGIPILMASVVGKSLMDSGAAIRIVRGFLNVTGEEKSELSLLGSSYLLSIPVFFDNVFYLLAPLARAMKARTKIKYPLYITCISAGALVTHTLVPPTPGPLAMASNIGVDVGMVMIVGLIIAIPCSVVGGLVYGRWLDKRLDIPLRETMGSTKESLEEVANKPLEELPGLGISLLPIILPVLFVGSDTITKALGVSESVRGLTSFVGNPTFALTTAALIAASILAKQKGFSTKKLAESLERSLESGGIIVAITAAGGAFGGLLKAAGVGQAIAGGLSELGIPLIVSAWLITGLIKIAQGSTTVALLTTSSIMAPFASQMSSHPVYLITAIGTGGMLFSWFNDSGFWIINKVAGLNESETFKVWSFLNPVMSITGLIMTLIMSRLFPLI